MKEIMRCRRIVVLPSLLLAVLLIAACGNSNKKSTSPANPAAPGPASVVGLTACTTCHTGILVDWLTSKHANLDPTGTLDSAGVPTIGIVQTGGQACINCHDPYSDSNNLLAGFSGNTPRPVVGCEACHGPGSLHVAAGGAGVISVLSGTFASTVTGTTPISGQFALCTSCHGLLDSSGTTTTAAVHGPASSVTPTGNQYTITDTHFASAGTYSADGHNLSTSPFGYSMDFQAAKVCTDCHNPHKAADENREWAASGHAYRSPTGPWGYYNWSCDLADCGDYGNRGTCQRCHTTTGYAAYATALENGDASLAAAIWTGSQPPIVYDSAFKPQMLTCKGCHVNNRGNLRNPGAYRATYKIPVGGFPASFPINADVSYQYPDAGASNVCMPCHTGRGSGRAIPGLNTGTAATVDFGNLGFPDGHYLTGGGTMFRGTGYQYPDRSYADPDSFEHKKIGTNEAPGTGTNGPCIGCHMERPGMNANHTFAALSTIVTSITGTIINVSSTVCFTCHPGSSIEFGSVVLSERENFEFGLEGLRTELAYKGWTFTPAAYPYFVQTNWLSPGDTDRTGNTTGKNNMGAAFNCSILYHEPGAYVHNSRYVRRLIYDSVDWIDDNQMNYSVGATLTDPAGPHAGQPYLAGAIKYLLPNGVRWQGSYPDGYGIAAERP